MREEIVVSFVIRFNCFLSSCPMCFTKVLFPRNKNISGSALFKVHWSQNLVWYSWKFEIFFALFLWKTILPEFLLIFVLYACHFLCVDVLILPLQLLTPPPVHRHAFHPVFVLSFFAILPDVDSMHFVTFLLRVKRLQFKIWFVLATGLAENLTQVIFRQPFVIQHVRTRSLNCETKNFFMFLYCHQHEINLWSLIFLLLHSCYFVIWVTKMHE